MPGAGGGKHKYECYWSQGTEEPTQFGAYSVQLLKSWDICPDFLVRTMKLSWTGEEGEELSRTVCQFHYSAWPDHGVPNEVSDHDRIIVTVTFIITIITIIVR